MESEVSMDDFPASALNDNFAFDSLQSIRNRLLDLTNRNRLLNFKHTTSGLIRIIDEMPDQLPRIPRTSLDIIYVTPTFKVYYI
ncbi:DUF4011 domain-containing protein [Shewanella sp. SR44-4]|nr:DUF4011 domain-containing protein [Shewanella sp. SR44-4]